MEIAQGLDQAKAKPRPCSLLVGRAGLFEGPSEPGKIDFGHATTRVFHDQHQVLALPRQPKDHAAPRRRRLDGIGDEVERHLLEGPPVGAHLDPLAQVRGDKLQAGALHLPADQPDDGRRCLSHVEDLEVQFEPFGFNAGHVEDIADQLQQEFAGLVDEVRIAPVPVWQGPENALAHGVGEPHYRVQRRPQFMRKIGQKAGLAGAAGLGVLQRLHQRLLAFQPVAQVGKPAGHALSGQGRKIALQPGRVPWAR